MVLLPEGKIINNPDTVKLIKVLPTTLNDQTFFVVALKLDDDSELMLDRCATRMEAEALADRCRRLLNGEELDSAEIPSFVEEEESGEDPQEESSDWDMSSDEEPAKPKTPVVEEESSSWDMSSSEDKAEKPVASAASTQEESSDWDMSSDEEPAKPKTPAVEEESSSWGFSSEEVESKPPQKSSKPKIQKPYTESEEPSPSASGKKAKKSSKTGAKSKPSKPSTSKRTGTEPVESKQAETVRPKSVPRVTGFIEDDSDEWIPDNGLDDWHD